MVVTVGIALIRVTPSNFLLESFLASVEGVKSMKSANNLEIIKTKQKKEKKRRRKKLNIFTHEEFSVDFRTPFHHIESLRPSISYPCLSFLYG